MNLYNALLPLFQKELRLSLLAWNTGGFPLRLLKTVSLLAFFFILFTFTSVVLCVHKDKTKCVKPLQGSDKHMICTTQNTNWRAILIALLHKRYTVELQLLF